MKINLLYFLFSLSLPYFSPPAFVHEFRHSFPLLLLLESTLRIMPFSYHHAGFPGQTSLLRVDVGSFLYKQAKLIVQRKGHFNIVTLSRPAVRVIDCSLT